MSNSVVFVPLDRVEIPYACRADGHHIPAAIEIYFSENFTAHSLTTSLPALGTRFASTTQLALCSILLRRYLATTTSETAATGTAATMLKPLSPEEKELVQPFIDDQEEQEYIFWMVRKVVEVFVTEPLRSSETLAEVVLLGSSLDKDTYRQLLLFSTACRHHE
jgi:hypothetical protein